MHASYMPIQSFPLHPPLTPLTTVDIITDGKVKVMVSNGQANPQKSFYSAFLYCLLIGLV